MKYKIHCRECEGWTKGKVLSDKETRARVFDFVEVWAQCRECLYYYPLFTIVGTTLDPFNDIMHLHTAEGSRGWFWDKKNATLLPA